MIQFHLHSYLALGRTMSWWNSISMVFEWFFLSGDGHGLRDIISQFITFNFLQILLWVIENYDRPKKYCKYCEMSLEQGCARPQAPNEPKIMNDRRKMNTFSKFISWNVIVLSKFCWCVKSWCNIKFYIFLIQITNVNDQIILWIMAEEAVSLFNILVFREIC